MFHGSIVAIVTPMLKDNSIDYSSLGYLIDWHIQEGTDGIVVLGSTGESATIVPQERKKIIEFTLGQVQDRIPVIVGTGTNCTAHTIELTQEAMELGADAALLVVPYYNKPTQEGLYQHFKTVASSVPIPQILYNVPTRTICDLLPETVQRLSECSNIIGIKEACGDLSRLPLLLDAKIDVFSGDDSTAFSWLSAGARGWISVVANIVPKLSHELYMALVQDRRQEANLIHEKIILLVNALTTETNPIPIKWALNEMGLIKSGIRLPLTPLSQSYHAKLRTALATANLLSL